MSLTKVSYSMITGALVNVLDYGADPTGTADSKSAIQAAIDYAQLTFSTVYFPTGLYVISGTLQITTTVHLYADGWPFHTSQAAVRIKYTGPASATTAVLKITATTAIHQLTINGICFDGNGLAGIGIHTLLSGSITSPLFQQLYVTGWTSKGFKCEGSGGTQMSEFHWEYCSIYSYDATGGYGITFENTTNCSNHAINHTYIAGESGFQLLNNVAAIACAVGNVKLNDVLFAQASSYAINLAGGWCTLNQCWNESAALLYVGNLDAGHGVVSIVDVEDPTTGGAQSVYFNTVYKQLSVIGGYFANNIAVGPLVNSTQVSIKGTQFAAGKGLYDDDRTSLITGFEGTSLPRCIITAAGGPFYPSGFASINQISMSANIALQAPQSSLGIHTFIFKYTGSGSPAVTFTTDYKLAGGAFTSTSTPGKADSISFACNTAGAMYETSRSMNMTT